MKIKLIHKVKPEFVSATVTDKHIFKDYYCPMCHGLVYDNYTYCPYCANELDWSKTIEEESYSKLKGW